MSNKTRGKTFSAVTPWNRDQIIELMARTYVSPMAIGSIKWEHLSPAMQASYKESCARMLDALEAAGLVKP